MPKIKYYAVAVGYQKGIFKSWRECEAQVKGFKGAKFKSFSVFSDAKAWIEENKFDSVRKADSSSRQEPPAMPKRLKTEATRKLKILVSLMEAPGAIL